MVRWVIYLENGSTWQAVLNEGGTVVVLGIGIPNNFVARCGSREAELERLNHRV